MAKKEKSRRRIKKDMLAHLENAFDLTQLDYAKRIKPKKEFAKISGLVAAFVIYALGFAGAYYGWKYNDVPFDLFVKITWVLMLPASVIGIVAWMLSFNRLENTVRHDFFVRIKNIEAEHGMIWRFRPLMSTFDPQNVAAKKVKKAVDKGKELSFDDIKKMPDTKVKQLLRNLDVEELSVALKDAGQELVEKVIPNLGKRAKKQYDELQKELKKVKKSDIHKYRKSVEDKLKELFGK